MRRRGLDTARVVRDQLVASGLPCRRLKMTSIQTMLRVLTLGTRSLN